MDFMSRDVLTRQTFLPLMLHHTTRSHTDRLHAAFTARLIPRLNSWTPFCLSKRWVPRSATPPSPPINWNDKARRPVHVRFLPRLLEFSHRRGRNGIGDPVDDVEEDECQRERLAGHLVNVTSSPLAGFSVDGARVGDVRLSAPQPID